MLCQGGGGEVDGLRNGKMPSLLMLGHKDMGNYYTIPWLRVFLKTSTVKKVNKQNTQNWEQQWINCWLSEHFITVVQATEKCEKQMYNRNRLQNLMRIHTVWLFCPLFFSITIHSLIPSSTPHNHHTIHEFFSLSPLSFSLSMCQ